MLGEPAPLLLLKPHNTLTIHATMLSGKARCSANAEHLAYALLTPSP